MSLHARKRAVSPLQPRVERQPRPTPRRRIRQRPRPPERRILVLGLAVSAALHVIFLLLVQFFFSGAPDPESTAAREAQPEREAWMHAYNVRAIEGEPPSIEEQIADRIAPPEPPAARPEPPAPLRPPVEEAPAEDAEAPTAVERLQRREPGDPRLWQRPGPRLTPPTDEERMRARVYGRIESWADSVMAAAEAERRALTWTHTTEDGKRWGISPEGIHLGDITLPAPSFAPPPGRREEVEARMREWSEIQRQAEMVDTRDTFRERVRRIRERRDRERESEPPPNR